MGVPGKRSIIDDKTVLSPCTGLRIFQDTCGRTCACRYCGNPIKSKNRRLCIATSGFQAMGKAGGLIRERKAFFHLECFQSYLGSPEERVKRPCLGCGVETEGISPANRARLTTLSLGVICDECRHSGCWLRCENCLFHMPKYRISETINNNGIRVTAKQICDECAEIYGATTVKSAKAERRAAAQVEEDRLAIVMKLTKKYLQ